MNCFIQDICEFHMSHHISFTVDQRIHDWGKIFYRSITLCWACQVSGINYPIDLQKKGFMSLVEIWSKRPIWKKVFPLKVIFSLFFFKWDYDDLEQCQTKKTNICFARPWEKPYQMSRRNKSITVKQIDALRTLVQGCRC